MGAVWKWGAPGVSTRGFCGGLWRGWVLRGGPPSLQFAPYLSLQFGEEGFDPQWGASRVTKAVGLFGAVPAEAMRGMEVRACWACCWGSAVWPVVLEGEHPKSRQRGAEVCVFFSVHAARLAPCLRTEVKEVPPAPGPHTSHDGARPRRGHRTHLRLDYLHCAQYTIFPCDIASSVLSLAPRLQLYQERLTHFKIEVRFRY